VPLANPGAVRYFAGVRPAPRSTLAVLPRALFLVAALPALGRASARAAYWERRLTLEQLAERLRTVAPFRTPWLRRRPEWLLASVERLLPLLPPRRYGACLRRSLLLLDLWSRCGLEVRLHLGVRRAGESAREAHAWVTTEAPRGGREVATSSLGYPEAFQL
jgi:hypothetical protein